jgi:hypothetical protein
MNRLKMADIAKVGIAFLFFLARTNNRYPGRKVI